MTLQSRISRLEDYFQKANPKRKEEVPIGVALGCGPEVFIGWYDWALHETSVWHSLPYADKYKIAHEFNYKPGFNIPEGFEGLTVVELLDTHLAFIHAEEKAMEESGGNDEIYYRLLEEEERRLKGTIKKRV